MQFIYEISYNLNALYNLWSVESKYISLTIIRATNNRALTTIGVLVAITSIIAASLITQSTSALKSNRGKIACVQMIITIIARIHISVSIILEMYLLHHPFPFRNVPFASPFPFRNVPLCITLSIQKCTLCITLCITLSTAISK